MDGGAWNCFCTLESLALGARGARARREIFRAVCPCPESGAESRSREMFFDFVDFLGER